MAQVNQLAPSRMVEDGKSQVTVVIPVKVGEQTKSASADLVRCLGRVLGVDIPTANQLSDVQTPLTILVGDNFGVDFGTDTTGLSRDGCIVKTRGSSIWITGPSDYGIANGIYTFLMDYAGVRWFSPGELYEVILANPDMTFPMADVKQNPAFQYRVYSGVLGEDAPKWQQRNRMNIRTSDLPYFGFGHNMSNILPPSVYGKKHPEYYALRDGKRQVPAVDNTQSIQPCYTNPDVIKVAAKAADDFFKKNPAATTFSLCMDDSPAFCQCPACSKLDSPMRKSKSGWDVYSDSYFHFVEQVAKIVEKTNPGKYLGVYAYWSVEDTPRHIKKLPENVVVALTQETSQYFDTNYMSKDRDLWLQWSKVASHLGKYDYYGLGWFTPRYFPTQSAEDIKFISDHSAVGFYCEIYPNWSVSAPQIYLGTRLLWDPSANPDAVLDEYFTSLYGAAAPEMKKFYSICEKYWTQPRAGQWFQGLENIRPELDIINDSMIEDAWQCLYKAKALVIGPESERVVDVENHFKFSYEIVKGYAQARRLAEWKITDRDDLAKMINESLKALEMVRLAYKVHKDNWLTDPRYAHTYYIGDRFNLKFPAWEDEVRAGVQTALLKVSDYCRTQLPEEERQIVWTDLRDRLMADPIAQRFKILDSLEPKIDCPKAVKPLSIDGDLSDWAEIPQVAFDPARSKRSQPTDNLNAFFKIAWDDRFFYFACEVEDSELLQAHNNESIWEQDSVQIGLDPQLDGMTYIGYGEDDSEIGFAKSPAGDLVWRWHAPKGQKTGKSSKIKLAVKHQNGKTVYEAAVPWSELAFPKVADNQKFAFSVLVNDISQNSERRYLEWGGGMARSKDPRQFVPVRLKK